MISDPAAAQRRRLVEALAQTLYEERDPSRIPWARRARVIRDAWLTLAERQIPRPAPCPTEHPEQ
jgi:hypothetical protein